VTASLWSARRLLLTMSSQSASTFANQVVVFVIPWLVLSRTGSALNAGGVAFATGIASVLGTLFGGLIVVTQVLGCCSTDRGWWPGTCWCPGGQGRAGDAAGGRGHVRGRHGPDRRAGRSGGPGLPRIPGVRTFRESGGPGVPGGPAAGLWTAARTPHPGGLPSRKGPHYQGVGLPHAQ
jgi:hypothetical protein